MRELYQKTLLELFTKRHNSSAHPPPPHPPLPLGPHRQFILDDDEFDILFNLFERMTNPSKETLFKERRASSRDVFETLSAIIARKGYKI